MTKELVCECPSKRSILPKYGGFPVPPDELKANHMPGCCRQKEGIRKFLRNGKEIYLCGYCDMPRDEEIE